MNFLNVDILWNLCWVLPLCVLLIVFAYKKRTNSLFKIFGNRFKDERYINVSLIKRILKNWLLIIAIIFIFLAAARPYWGYKIFPFNAKGRDILIVLDTSKSMLSQDVSPNRLAHAKLLIGSLIKDNPSDRYGIIVFAGTAFLECPLTADKTSLLNILADIDTNSISVGGTNIENALDAGIKAFSAAEGTYKAILLITDGDELQGNSIKAIGKLKQLKIPLFVVGVGDPNGPGLIQIQGDQKGQSIFLRDSHGNLVKSRLNETLLKKFAEATGGIYLRTTTVDLGLNVLEKRISQIVPAKYSEQKITRPLERFQFPLSFAVLLLLIWFLVGEKTNRKNSRSKSTVLLIGFLFFILPSLKAETKAVQKLTAIGHFNSGVEHQNKNENELAKQDYSKAVNASSQRTENIKSMVFQNIGVMQHKQAKDILKQNPEGALEILNKTEPLYKRAMRLMPERKDIAVNQQILLNDKKLAEELIKQQQQDQQNQQNQNQSQRQQNKKNQKQQQNQNNKQDKNQSQGQNNNQNQQQNQNQDKNQDQDKNNNQSKQADQQKQNNQEKQQQPNQSSDGSDRKNENPKIHRSNMPHQGQSKQYNDQEIDPNQAETLLKLMANDEKNLKDELKKRQKQNAELTPVDKDW